MTSVKSFTSRKDFTEAKKRARSNSLRRIQRDIEILFSDNSEQDRQILNILRRIGDRARYRLVYSGGGWCHLQLFVSPCHEQAIRRIRERLTAYKYQRIRIDSITLRKV